MAKISGELVTKRLEDGKRQLINKIEAFSLDTHIEVPKGFVTDFSSIPQVFASLIRWKRVDIAGVVHDRLYQTGEVPKDKADKIWFDVARSGEVKANLFEASAGWLGLKVGGWWAWNKHRKSQKELNKQYSEASLS